MKNIFKSGDKKFFEHIVQPEDIATFESGNVHSVYATFALTRDAEWSGRLFVLEMKEEDEEGIGTFVNVQHLSPAFVEDKVVFETTLEEVKGNEIICSFIAKIEERLIAKGTTGQKILKKNKIENLFKELKK